MARAAGAPCGPRRWVLLAAVLTSCLALLPEELSLESDQLNQELLVEYFSREFYKDRFAGALPAPQRAELLQLAEVARQQPVLALAAAQCLYMFAWFLEAPAGARAPPAGALGRVDASAAGLAAAAAAPAFAHTMDAVFAPGLGAAEMSVAGQAVINDDS